VGAIWPALAAEAGDIAPRVSALEGDWVATLSGNTGCGISSALVTFHLDAQGVGAGTAKITGHSTGCRDKVTRGLDFNIIRLGPHGKGKAGLSCGPGCGWLFDFQANRTNDIMALTDVEPTNPNNTLTGMAIKQ
jgi:hypothetical protein